LRRRKLFRVQISKFIFPKNQNSRHSRDSCSKSLTHNQQNSRHLIRNKLDRMNLRLSALPVTLFGNLLFTVEKTPQSLPTGPHQNLENKATSITITFWDLWSRVT
jgi:hypothetical protein